MNTKYYIFTSVFIAWLLAQITKPLFTALFKGDWNWKYMLNCGRMPSSHSAAVCSLCTAVGLYEGVDSTIFIVAFTLTCIVCYDACNVRYWAGQNISLTEQLIDDLKSLLELKFDDPIYERQFKKVLGHTYFEVLGGIILGVAVSFIVYAIMF